MSASIKAGLNNDMHLMTDGVTRAYVDGNGKVGIGTTSPSKKFVVSEGGVHGFEISPYDGSQNATRLINYNRSTNAYFPLEIEASQIAFETNGSEKMRIDPSGYVTTPSQPSFLAGMSALQSLVHATMTKVQFNQSVEQTGSNFSTSNYRFTCPVAGRYLFTWHVYVYSVKNMESKLYKNGSSLIRIASPVAYQDENPHGGGGSVILEANANDYFEIYAAGYHSSGSGSSVYPGSGAERSSSFSGMLIG
jgi:hypothetical protein